MSKFPNCPACGTELDDLNSKFCGECGKPIPRNDASSEEIAIRDADIATTKSSVAHTGRAPNSVDSAASPVLFTQCATSPNGQPADRSGSADGLPETQRLDAAGGVLPRHKPTVSPNASDDVSISIDINRNRVYREGHDGVLELRISNGSTSDAMIGFTVASTRCEWIGSPGRENLHFPPGGRKSVRMQMRPLSAGEVLFGLIVECKVGAAVHRFTAEPMIRVLETSATPQSLSITIDQSLKATGDVYAASMRSQADDLLKKGIIKSNNDLLERAFNDDWQPVDLFDVKVAEHARVRILSGVPRRAPMRDKASLHLHHDWVTGNILLLSQPLVRMGRNRDGNDVVLRFLPRSPQNDEITANISREHVAIAIEDDGLFLIDRSGSHEIKLDGRPVDQRAAIPLDRPSVFELAGAIKLRLEAFFESADDRHSSGHQYAQYGRPDRTWQIAERLGLRSLLIERVNNLPNEECYVIVYRWANVGCAAGAEVMIPGAGLEDVHARIVRLGQQFWLHAISNEGIIVDALPLPEGYICPLSAGMPMQLGEVSGEIAEFKQISL